jgi:hypothetical protein
MQVLPLVAASVHWALSGCLFVSAGYLLFGSGPAGLAALRVYEALVFLVAGAAFFRQRSSATSGFGRALATESLAVSAAALGLAVASYFVRHEAHGALGGLVVLFALPAVIFGLLGGIYFLTSSTDATRAREGERSAG